jgi:MerR family transcriptional regulator, mercuric resistance operon regulatory protein
MTGLRTGEVAQAAGVNKQTLRYYERRGLLNPAGRTPGGHRLYPPETVTLLRVVKAAQRLGFTLEEVTTLLADAALPDRAAAKLTEVETKIADLTVIATTLRATLEAGCADLIACAELPHCPVPFANTEPHQSPEDLLPGS